MEHLSRRLKTVLGSMGANVTSNAVVRAGTSLRTVHRFAYNLRRRLAHLMLLTWPMVVYTMCHHLGKTLKCYSATGSRFRASFAFMKGLLQH